VRTLRLRTFYRLCESKGRIPKSYYEYVRGNRKDPFDSATQDLWARAEAETEPLELGSQAGDSRLTARLDETIAGDRDWVLIGGPPCQAYSLAGRSRNRGVKGYSPEGDERHFLYQHYLRILAAYQPAVFVMENVKGILSSRVAGKQIFPQIVSDLSAPTAAVKSGNALRYDLRSLVVPVLDAHFSDHRDFIIRAEDHGVPQARHRVILVGIREDKSQNIGTELLGTPNTAGCMALDAVIGGLPPLRSGIRQHDDNTNAWCAAIEAALRESLAHGLPRKWFGSMRDHFRDHSDRFFRHGRGSRFVRGGRPRRGRTYDERQLLSWMRSTELGGVLNHQARTHMPSDLVRYLFAATFAIENGRSPTAREFPEALAPKHRNWQSGAFADRFRVQAYGTPSTTVTSHISKDGHYYIHPDPRQCRSLTVREAARLQTFPDDFFFEGNRTEQYVQVGNAVPPFLACQIAGLVARILARS